MRRTYTVPSIEKMKITNPLAAAVKPMVGIASAVAS